MSAATGFLFLTLASVGALLGAEAREARVGVWLAKPLASLGFVGLALAAGAGATPYGRGVLAALALCLAGDVLLIPASPLAFRAGILAFLLGHAAFVAAFALRGIEPGVALGVAAASVLPAALLLRWLSPRLTPEFRAPVFAYVAVISLMLAAAAGSVARGGDPRILAGALGFYLSDLAVARDRFVAPGFVNRAWGLPLYYAAQLLFALSASAP
jgi:uncharacterized membrane protein YhhN